MVGWVFFRAETLSQALHFLGAMAGVTPKMAGARALSHYLTEEVALLLLIGAVGSTPIVPWTWRCLLATVRRLPAHASSRLIVLGDAIRVSVLFVILGYSAMQMAGQAYSPFIYYRF
jgi:alginate O-acetyltransferase complex protein AlgI